LITSHVVFPSAKRWILIVFTVGHFNGKSKPTPLAEVIPGVIFQILLSFSGNFILILGRDNLSYVPILIGIV